MRNNFTEAAVASILIILAVLSLNPLGFYMPNAVAMAMIAVLTVVFAVFAGLVWREQPRDEREALHRLLADRFGFLAGAAVLVGGIAWQSLGHNLNPWLVATLVIMLLAKIAGIIHSRNVK